MAFSGECCCVQEVNSEQTKHPARKQGSKKYSRVLCRAEKSDDDDELMRTIAQAECMYT